MYVKVRLDKLSHIVVVQSKLSKIEDLRINIKLKFNIEPESQLLCYGGKVLEDGCSLHDYNIKLGDVIQLIAKAQPIDTSVNESKKTVDSNKKTEIVYEDAVSTLYTVGDLIDVRDETDCAWFEAVIARIVYDPKKQKTPLNDKENIPDTSNTSPQPSTSLTNRSSITKYLIKSPKNQAKEIKMTVPDEDLLYKIEYVHEEADEDVYCELKNIRPRARRVIEPEDLVIGDTVMLNADINELGTLTVGLWYDFKIKQIDKHRRDHYSLWGTLCLNDNNLHLVDTKIRVVDKIYAIETIVPLSKRTEQDKINMSQETEKRTRPLKCKYCYDVESKPCKHCGCYSCYGKDKPEEILLCDECDQGYHMTCLDTPLTELPEEDWYCPSCRRDTKSIVAPGARKQTKKEVNTSQSKDWGRGMACMGKTKESAMPIHHFGPIPGVEVGMCWRFRIQLSEIGLHRPPVSGIHGRDCDGAYSIVLSGGYEDDYDDGEVFTYTGSGGRDLSGNKRTAQQSCDQKLTRENRALARNCAVDTVCEKGADAGDLWRDGKPVRVIRASKMAKHFPKYAPEEGFRYDGIYKVVKYYPEKGMSGFRVWKYLLRRDDPSPAPWLDEAKKFSIVYPDGYLEAEAEKASMKGKGKNKRTINEDSNESGPSKAKKIKKDVGKQGKKEDAITAVEREAMDADTANRSLWRECLIVAEARGRQEYVEYVYHNFLCSICQGLVTDPVTTSCGHNYCIKCLKTALKTADSKGCPVCRNQVDIEELKINENLKLALLTIWPGYDANN